jgi:alcohol dehydrogenase (cytochrome c)
MSWGCSPGESSYEGYTVAEAERGQVAYHRYCVNCHGDDLSGAGFSSALAGEETLASWGVQGWTADDLFYVIRANMPPGSSRLLSEQERLDLVAYLLQENGFPAGDTPLRAEADYLSSIALGDAAEGADFFAAAEDFMEGEGAPSTERPTTEELLAAHLNDADWIYHTGDYTGRRSSGLTQIDRTNVGSLTRACSYPMGETTRFQTGPIIYSGTMFVTTVHETVALDARTCEEQWKHVWEAPAGDVWPNNRGVALSEGRVVRGTSDGYLVALDAQNGALLWARKVASALEGETITMAPMIFEDRILVGPAGSENAIKGWVGAFSVEDGSPLWRFNIVPKPGEPGYETWDHSNDFPVGGGATWTPMSLDAAAGVLFVAATNPAPDFPAAMRGGDNLYTNSVIALDVRSGELLWYDQLVPADDHDWDLTQVSPLFTATVAGQERNLIGTVGKDGVLRLLDRDRHERLWETPVTTIENIDEPVSVAGVHACPGVLGGVEWNGPSYSALAGMLYTPAVDWCGTFFAADTIRYVPGANYLGGTYMFDETSQGWLTAVDVATGDVAWRYRSEGPMVAAVTSTAGGLVFTGELSGDFLAFDATTGEELARIPTGGPIGGGVVTYAVEGKQYVAVASGNPSPFWVGDEPGVPTLIVYTLPE